MHLNTCMPGGMDVFIEYCTEAMPVALHNSVQYFLGVGRVFPEQFTYFSYLLSQRGSNSHPKSIKGTGVIPLLEPPPPGVTAVSRILSGRVTPAWTAISLKGLATPARLATGATLPGVPPDRSRTTKPAASSPVLSCTA